MSRKGPFRTSSVTGPSLALPRLGVGVTLLLKLMARDGDAYRVTSQNFVCVARASGSQSIHEATQELGEQLQERQPRLVLAFVSPDHDRKALRKEVVNRWPEAAFLHASSAGEFTHKGEGQGGVALWALGGDLVVRTGFASGLAEDMQGAVEGVCRSIPDHEDGYTHRVGILLLDPMAGCGEQATLLTAMTLERGDPVRLVGGAAADHIAMERTFVGVGDQEGSDAIALAMIYSKTPFGIGVGHGHQIKSDALTVTRSKANIVYEVNGRPAWDMWLEHTRDLARAEGWDVDAIPEDQIPRFFLTYQMGLLSQEGEIKIRTPLKKLEDGSIQFAGALPEGAKFHLTTGTPTSQVQSAEKAANDARNQIGEAKLAGALIFDCICRKLILKERFFEAVSAASGAIGSLPVAGFETYGEVALNDGDLSGFHNTSTVVLAVPA